MKNKTLIFLTVILVVASVPVLAGNQAKTGTAGAPELMIAVGSRGSAMGGAVIANPMGLEAIYWNPAGLATIEGTEIMLTQQPYLAGVKVNFGAIATSMEGIGTLAASAKVVTIGDMEETTVGSPEGTGRVYSPTLSVIGVSYARQLTANVAVGLNGFWVNERIFEVSANGTAFDFGVTFDPKWRGLQIGFAIKNYGPDMKFSGPGFDRAYEAAGQRRLSAQSSSFSLPSHFDIGLAYPAYNRDKNMVTLSGNFLSNNFGQDHLQGGAEYSYDNKYFLRTGYNYSQQTDNIYGFSFGGGLSYNLGNTKLTLEYAWTQTDTFTDNQYFTLRMNF